MPMMPFQVLGIWLRGLLSVAAIALAGYLLKEWYDSRTTVPQPLPPAIAEAAGADIPGDQPRGEVGRAPGLWHLGFDRDTAYLLGGLALAFASLGGGMITYPLLRRNEAHTPQSAAEDQPYPGATYHRIARPDGTELHVATLGPEDAPAVVMTHGWGVDSSEWKYSEKILAERHRLIFWDLPGLGRSKRPSNNDFSLEKMAGDLDAVLDFAGGGPKVVVGHSIGGMITLTYCRIFPEKAARLAGLVLLDTTYTNPARTAKMGSVLTAIQKPVLEPLCYLMIGLAPLVYVMNWLSYLNGSMHRSTEKTSFAGTESRQQLDLATRYSAKAWPGVVARGMLGMFRYDATEVLPRIQNPTLVIVGDEDPLTPPEASQHIAETIPNASLRALKPAKHMSHMEHHDDFARDVVAFLDEVAAARPAAVR